MLTWGRIFPQERAAQFPGFTFPDAFTGFMIFTDFAWLPILRAPD